MPEPISKPIIDPKNAATADVVSKTQSHAVSDEDLAAASLETPGFKILEGGNTVVAASKAEFAAALAAGEIDAKGNMLKPEPKAKKEPKPEVVVEEDAEAEAEEETNEQGAVELNEDEFLEHHGLKSKFIKTMKDVDKDIKFWQGRLEKLDGYDGNEELFMVDSDSEPELKVETLKQLRSAVNRAQRQSKEAPAKEESKKRPIDQLTDDDKERLNTGEGILEIIDKLTDIKVNEKMSPAMRKIQQAEYREMLSELGVTQAQFDADVKSIIAKNPYLKKVLPTLTLEETVTLFQQFRAEKSSKNDQDSARAENLRRLAMTDAKRRANVTLKPTRAAREVPTADKQEIEKLQSKIDEARQARKDGRPNSRVSNLYADYTRPRRGTV